MKGFPKEMKITSDMVGLKFTLMNVAHGKEFNEYIANIKILGLSDDGLELFECSDEDCQA